MSSSTAASGKAAAKALSGRSPLRPPPVRRAAAPPPLPPPPTTAAREPAPPPRRQQQRQPVSSAANPRDSSRWRASEAIKARALAARSARELLDVMAWAADGGGGAVAAVAANGGVQGPPLPPPAHAVAALAARLVHVLQYEDADDAKEDGERHQNKNEAERLLCSLLRGAAPHMQFPNAAGSLGAVGQLMVKRRRRRDDEEHLALLSQTRDVLAARLAACPVAREARGGGGDSSSRSGFWLGRAATGLARSGATDPRAWARVAALAGALAPRLEGSEVGAVCWALGRRRHRRRGNEDEDDDDDDVAAPTPVFEFAADALATRAAELAPTLSLADVCSALGGLSVGGGGSASVAAVAALTQRAVEVVALALAQVTAESPLDPRHVVGLAHALARLRGGGGSRRQRRPLPTGELAAALVEASASVLSRPLTPHEACVFAWSIAGLGDRELARRVLVEVLRPLVGVGGDNAPNLTPPDAAMLASALARARLGGGAAELTQAATCALATDADDLDLRTVATALWALTRLDKGEAAVSLLRRCEQLLLLLPTAQPPSSRDVAALSLALGTLVRASDDPLPLRCLELLLSDQKGRRSNFGGARELSAVAWAAVGAASKQPQASWPREVITNVATSALPLILSARACEASRLMEAAAVVGGAETPVAALWSACARRLLQIARAASIKSVVVGDRLGSGSVARAAWALAEMSGSGGGSCGNQGQRQRRLRRSLARALAGRANVLLALTLRARGSSLVSPELVVTPRDAQVMLAAFAKLTEREEEQEEETENERGRSASPPCGRGSSGQQQARSLSRSRSRPGRPAVLDSPAFWARLEEVGRGQVV